MAGKEKYTIRMMYTVDDQPMTYRDTCPYFTRSGAERDVVWFTETAKERGWTYWIKPHIVAIPHGS